MMTDPIADMLTRIRNSAVARHDRVDMPHSKVKEAIARVLKAEGYVDDVRVSTRDDEAAGPKTLTVVLRYGRDRQCAIDNVRRVSKPGRRVYVRHDHLPRVRFGMGIAILSTSRGVMTDKQAKGARVGGELLCEVW
jgi:small subunit ribosomal protein S8